MGCPIKMNRLLPDFLAEHLAEPRPIDLGPKPFAANGAVGQLLYRYAVVVRNRTFAGGPLLYSWRRYAEMASQRGLAAHDLARLDDGFVRFRAHVPNYIRHCLILQEALPNRCLYLGK